MGKKQEYYKVVSVENNKLYSVMKSQLGEFGLQYYVHRPVTAKVGGILVFTSADAALSFSGSKEAIYRCTVRDEILLPSRRLYLSHSDDLNTIPLIWERAGTTGIASCTLPPIWPRDTKAFRTITLRERVR